MGIKPKKSWIYCPSARKQKIHFAEEKQALAFIRFNAEEIGSQNAEGKKPVRAYYCPICCAWHVTSKEAPQASAVQEVVSPEEMERKMLLQRNRDRQKAEWKQYIQAQKDQEQARQEQIRQAQEEMSRMLSEVPVYEDDYQDIEDVLIEEEDDDPALVWGAWIGVSRAGKVVPINEIRVILEENGLSEPVWEVLSDLSKAAALRKLGMEFSEDKGEAEGEMDIATQHSLYEKSFKTFTDDVAVIQSDKKGGSSAPKTTKDAKKVPQQSNTTPLKPCTQWGRWFLPSNPTLNPDTLRARLELAGYDRDIWDMIDEKERIRLMETNL